MIRNIIPVILHILSTLIDKTYLNKSLMVIDYSTYGHTSILPHRYSILIYFSTIYLREK